MINNAAAGAIKRLGWVKMEIRMLSTSAIDKKVAVLGAGLAGLSTAWHLHDKGVKCITILDPRPPGHAEASSVAGGLLHPLTPKNRLIWCGEEGFEASTRLLTHSQKALAVIDPIASERLISRPGSILRPALTDQHWIDYQQAAEKLPQWLEWLNGEALTKKAGPEWKGGLLLKYSRIISMSDYLRGLWFSLQKPSTQKGDGKGGEVTWQSTAVDSLASIRKNYDVIVIASGAGIRTFPELKQLEVEFVKGKTLIMEDEQDGSSGPLGSALLCGEYVVPGFNVGLPSKSSLLCFSAAAAAAAAASSGQQRRVLRCGATKEYIKDPWSTRKETDEDLEDDDHEAAKKSLEILRQKAERLYAPLKNCGTHIAITEGTRVATKRSNFGKLPIIGRVPEVGHDHDKEAAGGGAKIWLYTGLGGRGLIHHAYLGERLAEAILHDDDSILPPQVRKPLDVLERKTTR